jgi:hypothetical protein
MKPENFDRNRCLARKGYSGYFSSQGVLVMCSDRENLDEEEILPVSRSVLEKWMRESHVIPHR